MTVGAAYDDGEGMSITREGAVIITRWYGNVTLARINVMFEQQKALVGDLPFFATLNLADPAPGRDVEGPARRRAAELGAYWGARQIVAVTVFRGGALSRTVLRLVVGAIVRLTQRHTNAVVAADFEDGMRILRESCATSGVAFDEPAVRAAIMRLGAPR